MEPVEYAKVAKRHWKLLVGLVLAAVALVYLTSPERVTDSYSAKHVLLVETTGEGRTAEAETNPEILALWTTVGDVPERAADTLGDGTDPAKLAATVEAEADRSLGTVTITATDDDPDRAELVANTFAAELVAFIEDREAERVSEESTETAVREQSLRNRIAGLDAAIARNPTNIDTLTAEREALLRQLGQILDEEAAPAPAEITTLQAATSATQDDRLPGTRSRTQRMVLAGLVALLLGFGLAIVLDRSDTRLRTRRDAENHFDLPVIAEIPQLVLKERRRRLVSLDQPDSDKAEAYRTLRAAVMLHRSRVPSDRDVVLITSPSPTDGKTTTVANLAVAYAETGRSVLVLSCDVWRTSVAQRFGVRSGSGVSDFIADGGETPLESYVRSTDVPGVRVVTSGVSSRRPGGRLVAGQRLIAQARALADVVIVDTAPLLNASMTRELATMVDTVVVACRVGRTTAAEAERSAEILEQLQAPSLGVVLLGVPGRRSNYFSRSGQREEADATAHAAEEPLASSPVRQTWEPSSRPDPVADQP